jgi:hypothetical protein
MGAARGFDMSTEEGINEWILAYNQELTSSGAKSSTLQKGRAHRKKQEEERRKRKMAEASRKKNRRRR